MMKKPLVLKNAMACHVSSLLGKGLIGWFVFITIAVVSLLTAQTSSAQLPEIHRFQKFELNVNPVTDINDTFIRNLALRHYKARANKALPEIFGMEDPEWAAHQDYIDYVEMLALLQVEERLPVELSSEEIETLINLASNERSYASAWARTLLTLSNTGYLFQEPIIIDQEYMPRKGRKITVVNHLMPTISVYPNPANELLNIVLSECFINQNDCLVVSDISGKEVYKLVLSAAQQGCIIDVTKWKDGVYIISLWQNGQKSLHKIVSICR
jgi:hypothetical protein